MKECYGQKGDVYFYNLK